MKTNPYPYAGNNPVNFVDPLGMDYTYWSHPYPGVFCRNTVYEDCNKACDRVHAWTDCFPIFTSVYGRFLSDDPHYAVEGYDPAECHECWHGHCYDACKHLVPPGGPNECVMVNEEEVMECLKSAGCIFDFPFWIPIVDGNQPLGDGGKGPNPPRKEIDPKKDPNNNPPLYGPPLPPDYEPPTPLEPQPPPVPPNPPGTDPGNENDGEESKRFWGFGTTVSGGAIYGGGLMQCCL